MANLDNSEKPHSAEYFGDYRDFWWNRDFLELMATRLQLEKVKIALDVGCGIGHWGQVLASVMPKDSNFIGVDREKEWVEQATAKANKEGDGSRFRYQHGDVNALPFPDSTFDMVTCQTVLIHVPEPKKSILEMIRVLKPGGILLAVEPNNLANHSVANILTMNESISYLSDIFRFKITCERGKTALGLGNISVGDLVPGYFAELGVKNIAVYLSDKAVSMFQPYESKEQEVNLKQSLEWKDKEFLIWDKNESKKYFIAGGGSEEDFKNLWDKAIKSDGSFEQALKDQTYHSAGGSLMYLICGLKA
jgi:SAM-dependent methyltransferase